MAAGRAMSEREKEILTEHEAQGMRSLSQEGAPTPSAVGAMLRATRQRYGWDLEDIETALRIRLAHLQAIEEGRLEDLPGPAYAIGFVRAYADHLGLEREEVVNQFRDEISDLPRRTQLNFPTPIPESRIPSGAIIAISIAVALGAYGGWYYLTMKNRSGVELVTEVPRQIADLLKPSAESGGTPPSEAAASPSHEESAAAPVTIPAPPPNAPTTANAPAPSSTAAPVVPPAGGAPPATVQPEQPAAPAAAESAPDHKTPGEPTASEQFAALPVSPDQGASDGEGSQVFGKSNTNVRIVIRANADSWVQVRDNDGELILTRMLRSGDSYRVPNKVGLTLLTGNAGALEIYVDGRKAPALGPGGAIRRDVPLDADRLLAGTAADN